MERSEKETIILINQEDLAEGYFVFDTCLRAHFERLCRRIGGKEQLMGLRIDRTKQGNERWWSAKVPKRFLSMATFGVKSARKMAVSSLKNMRAVAKLETKGKNTDLRT